MAWTQFVDAAMAPPCAGLPVPDRRGEHDALIAATALVRGMTWVTRKVAVFPSRTGQGRRMCIHRKIYTPMRTNIVIDDQLMQDVLRATGLKTKREAVDLALRALLRLRQQARIRELRGRLDWQGDLDAMRTDA